MLFSIQIKQFIIGVFLCAGFVCLAFSLSCSTKSGVALKTDSDDSLLLEVPKIYLGQDLFNKREIFRNEKTKEEKEIPMVVGMGGNDEKPRKIDEDEFTLNRITKIFAGEVDNEKGTDILVASDENAFILDMQGKVKKEINYHLGTYIDTLPQGYNLPFVSIVDIDNDGKVEIAGHGNRACLIINLQGKTIWKYKNIGKGKDVNVDHLAIADVDGDGKNEAIVTDHQNLEILNLDGTLRLKKEFGTWLSKLEITDFNNDGKKEILAGSAILDGNGEVIDDLDDFYFTGVSNLKNENTLFLKFERNTLNFFDVKGNINRKVAAPLSSLERRGGYTLYSIETKNVRLKTNEADYVVVLASADDHEEFDNFKMLYVYDSKGELVYHETIQAFDGEMSVLPNEDGTESLLVTDDGKLNLYTVK